MTHIVRRLILSLALALWFYGGIARGAKPEHLSRMNARFYKPTAAEMQHLHDAFIADQKKTNRTVTPSSARVNGDSNVLRNVTERELGHARALVKAAHTTQAAYNKWNIENPRTNNYHLKKQGHVQKKSKDAMVPPKFSQEVLDAIKLVGDVDAKDMCNNGTLQSLHDDIRAHIQSRMKLKTRSVKNNLTSDEAMQTAATGGWWLGQLDHSKSSQPFGGDSSYKVWRNVLDYGAVGDGVHDDTAAIQKAISDGNRCGANCPGSTINGAVVYLPSNRVYRISSSIILYYNTQLVGDVGGVVPILQAATSFTGNGLISSDVYLSDGTSEWYINTANFYRQVRNIMIDMRLATVGSVKAFHWQVAQAASIDSVGIMMSNDSSTTQIGIFAENGSGGWISDMTISGGEYGFLGGNQQYSVAGLDIFGSKKCIGLIWDWAWSWSHLRLEQCNVAIDLTAPGSNPTSPVGSVMLVDAKIISCSQAIRTYHFASSSSEKGTTVLSLNNVVFSHCDYFIYFPDDTYLTQDVSAWTVGYLQLGDEADQGTVNNGFFALNVTRPAVLTDAKDSGTYFRRPKPYYGNYTTSTVYNAKLVARGDGVTDDTAILQALLNYCAEKGYVLYLPAGSYMIGKPLLIPNNSRVFGESWSQLVAYGSQFADEQNPSPMVTVGQGETNGIIEMQNLLFTSKGALPGLVLVEWNIQAASQGSVALWDCHFRVGGAKGTDLQVANCPKLTGSMNPQCKAGTMMLLMNPSSNGYFENMWAWVADHDIDFPASDDTNQIDIYMGRGILVQGDGPNWFRGTASEHSTLYQYNLVNASNIYMSMIQTESPYYQGAAGTQAPTPFTAGLWVGDPTFDMCGSNTTSCNSAWAIIIQWTNMVFIDGAGLYSWFQNYNQACVNNNTCQQRLVNIFHSGNLLLNHLVTIGSVEVVTPAISNTYNDIIYAVDHLQATGYPWWTTIATYLDSSPPIQPKVSPSPVKTGWVAFGDSYAAGIGAGLPYDNVRECARGTGGHPPILNDIFRLVAPVNLNFQNLACSGETAQQFLNHQGIDQLTLWQPGSSDLGTVSFTGNDLGFGNIVSHCIMGYKSRDNCEQDIATAKSKLDQGELISDLVFSVMDNILDKVKRSNPEKRFTVYWTGYPKFFAVEDDTCDHCWFREWWYAGNYLTTQLRSELNELSYQVNNQLNFAIRRYNAGRTYPVVVWVSPDDTRDLYGGHRFCEKGVGEPLKGSAQNAVAFFYHKGDDDVPESPFHLPLQLSGAPGTWQLQMYQSETCNDNVTLFDGDWGSELLCDISRGIASGTISADDFNKAESPQAFAFTDGKGDFSVVDLDVSYTKMFHPKTRANWHIAQAVFQALRVN